MSKEKENHSCPDRGGGKSKEEFFILHHQRLSCGKTKLLSSLLNRKIINYEIKIVINPLSLDYFFIIFYGRTYPMSLFILKNNIN